MFASFFQQLMLFEWLRYNKHSLQFAAVIVRLVEMMYEFKKDVVYLFVVLCEEFVDKVKELS
jgi:hypothetical protein